MEIESLTVTNWGPYVGTHEVDLSVSESAPVVVIHGENDRGKTSFLRAISFGLYGKVKEGGLKIPIEELASQRLLESGEEVHFAVMIRFDHEGEKFVIERSGGATQTGGVNSPVELTTPLSVEFRTESGTLFPESAVPDRINGILDEDISDFYLFDGERLAEIIRKLTSRQGSQVSAEFVKSSVERAVGLSFVGQMINDMKGVRDDLYSGLQKDLKTARAKERLVADIKDKQDEIDRVDRDRDEVTAEKTKHSNAAEAIQLQLDQFVEIRDLVVERQTLQKQRTEAEEELEELYAQRRSEGSANWLFPLRDRLDSKITDLHNLFGEASKAEEERQGLLAEKRLFSSADDTTSCAYCGHDLSEKEQAERAKRLSEIETALNAVPQVDQSPSDLSAAIRSYSAMFESSAGGSLFTRILDKIDDREDHVLDLTSREKKLTARIGKSESPDIVALEDSREEKKTQIQKADLLLEKIASKKKELTTSLVTLQKKLRDSPEVSDESRSEVQVLDDAIAVSERAFVSYREKMRDSVERFASEALRQMSSEPEFKTLRIGQEYQISVLNEDGVPQKHSKGYEQVSAMAFIAGLAATAGKSNLMVMDTPLGRLDLENRRGVLGWASQRPSQTILFVQSGELTESEARELIGKKIGRQLKLKRVRQGSTEVVEVRS